MKIGNQSIYSAWYSAREWDRWNTAFRRRFQIISHILRRDPSSEWDFLYIWHLFYIWSPAAAGFPGFCGIPAVNFIFLYTYLISRLRRGNFFPYYGRQYHWWSAVSETYNFANLMIWGIFCRVSKKIIKIW